MFSNVVLCSMNIGDKVVFKNENLSGVITAIYSNDLVGVTIEDDFELKVHASEVIVTESLVKKTESPAAAAKVTAEKEVKAGMTDHSEREATGTNHLNGATDHRSHTGKTEMRRVVNGPKEGKDHQINHLVNLTNHLAVTERMKDRVEAGNAPMIERKVLSKLTVKVTGLNDEIRILTSPIQGKTEPTDPIRATRIRTAEADSTISPMAHATMHLPIRSARI